MANKERIQANNAELREAIEMAENLPSAGEGGGGGVCTVDLTTGDLTVFWLGYNNGTEWVEELPDAPVNEELTVRKNSTIIVLYQSGANGGEATIYGGATLLFDDGYCAVFEVTDNCTIEITNVTFGGVM